MIIEYCTPRTFKIFITTALLALQLQLSTAVYAQEEDELLLRLPAIIAGSLRCDLTNLESCFSRGVCEKSGGHWFWEKCYTDPKGLVVLRLLAGTWDFYFRWGENNENIRKRTFSFYMNTIRRGQRPGEYIISGKSLGKSKNAYYDGDVITISELSYGSLVKKWKMPTWENSIESGRLSGSRCTGSVIPILPLDCEPAWAIKR